jgi:aminoglycoside 6'-N-acetyltransferase I
MAIELVRVTPAARRLLDRIADEVFDEPIRPDRLAAYVTAPGHLMIVAVDDGVVVAQCAAVIHSHPDKVTELYIDELGTAASHRRQGIARRLIGAMFDWGRELGCKESWLGTELDNVEANGLYRSIDHKYETMAYYEFNL